MPRTASSTSSGDVMTLTSPLARRVLALLFVLACAGCATTSEAPGALAPAPPDPLAVPVKPLPAAKPPARPAVPPPTTPPPPIVAPSLGADELAKGMKSYDDGEYSAAVKQFQAALDLGLALPNERATAHKHLAFMACVSKRTSACRAEFRKALAADPVFDLAPAEAGHPTWGPVFQRVKAEASKSKAR